MSDTIVQASTRDFMTKNREHPECLACFAQEDTRGVICRITGARHDGYGICAPCEEEWYGLHDRCLVCNISVQPQTAPVTAQHTRPPTGRGCRFCFFFVVYALFAYAIISLILRSS